jgi:hypothetical protein
MDSRVVPSEIILATANGDVATVRSWLESGGDANQDLPDDYRNILPDEGDIERPRLLTVATEYGCCDIIRTLVAHGAEVDYECSYYGSEVAALYLAVDTGNLDAARVLIESGADDTRLRFSITRSAILDPPLLRALLIFGADASAWIEHDAISFSLLGSAMNTSEIDGVGITPEAYARSRRDYFASNPMDYDFAGVYREATEILEGTRLAGSYKGYVLAPFKELLRLRSLLARGRARIEPDAPEAVARLFGGRIGATTRRARPPTRRHRPPPNRAAGVPDPVFWKVMEYWSLGDWRRPWAV